MINHKTFNFHLNWYLVDCYRTIKLIFSLLMPPLFLYHLEKLIFNWKNHWVKLQYIENGSSYNTCTFKLWQNVQRLFKDVISIYFSKRFQASNKEHVETVKKKKETLHSQNSFFLIRNMKLKYDGFNEIKSVIYE